MSAGVVALLVAVSASVWAYTKLQNHTGYGNSRSALTGAAVVFALTFIVVFSIGHLFLK